jgi:hypothetical protein
MSDEASKFGCVKCPYCQREIDDAYIRQHAASLAGRVKSPRKKKDPEKMREIGKLGAAKRWAKKK